MATDAPTPDGYSLVFSDKDASLSASNYMGLYTLTSFDTLECASKCDQANGCEAFNVYAERDPSVDPNQDNCPNPPSTTNYKCTLWGAPVVVEEATNKGQYRDDFQVVITGSNGKSGLDMTWDTGAELTILDSIQQSCTTRRGQWLRWPYRTWRRNQCSTQLQRPEYVHGIQVLPVQPKPRL